MLIRIAFKNIWRSKIRSFVVIFAIALGLWAGIFASAFVNGMMTQKIDSVIDVELSHFQFHEKGFRDEFSAKLFMPQGEEICQNLNNDTTIKGVSGRIISMAMLGSANKSGMVKVIGISPDNEKRVTILNKKVEEGQFFEGVKRNPILISHKIAKKYNVKLRSKLVLTFQDINDEIIASSFRVVGIYDTKNGMYDNMNVFVQKKDLRKLLQLPTAGLSEIAVRLKKHDNAEITAERYQKQYPKIEVLSWLDLGLGMRYMIEMMGSYTAIVVGIILIALLFSIINTMLMAVLERTQELGMLMAIGMAKQKIFFMILYETLFLSFIGAPLGFLLAYLTILYFGESGINLGTSAMEEMGYASIVFPVLALKNYIQTTIMVMIMAILAAIYPAKKALELNPVEAIRKI